MSGVTGRQVDCAFAKTGTNSWGVAASVTKGHYFQSTGGLQLEPMIVEDDAFGQEFIETAEVGNITAPTPPFSSVDRYDDYGYILDALSMGSPAAVTLSTSAAGQTTSWLHQIDLAPVIDGLAVTFAFDKVLYIEELTSAKLHGFREEDSDNGMMRSTYKVMGSKTTNVSSVNINSTIAVATFPSLGNRVMKKHGVWRMNKHSAGALGASDVIKVEKAVFDFDRAQDGPFIYGQDFIDEPADNGFPVFSIEMTYPRMNSTSANSLYAGLRDSTAFKADWTFSGAFINSTDQYQKKYQFPYMQLDKFVADVVGANQVKPTATWKARQAPTSPTGMAFIRPFRLTRIMVNSVHAFA